jgi:hypothetical protein
VGAQEAARQEDPLDLADRSGELPALLMSGRFSSMECRIPGRFVRDG